jgi:hypothetical protein
MIKIFRAGFAWLVLAVAGVLSFHSAAAQPGNVVLNLLDANVDTLIEAVADMTDKRFVLDPRVRGMVTLDNVTLNTPEEAYDLLSTTLRDRGFLVVPSGGDVKIVPDPKRHTSQYGAGEPERVISSSGRQPEPRPTQAQPTGPLVSLQPVKANGAQRGYRVFPRGDPAAFTRLGFDAGDVVLTINGRALSDPAQGEVIFNAEIKKRQVTVTLERGTEVRRLLLSRR